MLTTAAPTEEEVPPPFIRPPLTRLSAFTSLVKVTAPEVWMLSEFSMYPPDVPMEGTAAVAAMRMFWADWLATGRVVPS